MPPAGSAVWKVQGALRAACTFPPSVDKVCRPPDEFVKSVFFIVNNPIHLTPPISGLVHPPLMLLSLPAALIFLSLRKPLVLVPSYVCNHASVQVAAF